MQHSYSNPTQNQSTQSETKKLSIPQYAVYAVVGIIVLYLVSYFLPTSLTSFIPNPFGKKSDITVTGAGSVKTTPDIAGFAVTVADTGVDSNSALNNAKEEVNQLINSFKGLGLIDEDINIASYSVAPSVVGESVIYAAGTTVIVSTKNLFAADDLVTAALTQGGRLSIPLTYSVSDREIFEIEARDLAIKDAEKNAKEVASSFNKRLGKMTTYAETQTQTSQTTESSSDQTAGEITISRAVQVTFKTK